MTSNHTSGWLIQWAATRELWSTLIPAWHPTMSPSFSPGIPHFAASCVPSQRLSLATWPKQCWLRAIFRWRSVQKSNNITSSKGTCRYCNHLCVGVVHKKKQFMEPLSSFKSKKGTTGQVFTVVFALKLSDQPEPEWSPIMIPLRNRGHLSMFQFYRKITYTIRTCQECTLKLLIESKICNNKCTKILIESKFRQFLFKIFLYRIKIQQGFWKNRKVDHPKLSFIELSHMHCQNGKSHDEQVPLGFSKSTQMIL